MKISSIITLEGGFYFPDPAVGATFEERAAYLREIGCDAMEIWGEGLDGQVERVKRVLKSTGLTVSTICSGFRGCLLSPERESREMALGDMKKLMSIGGELGALGMVMVPYFSFMPRIKDLLPYKSAMELQFDVLYDMLHRLGEHGEKVGCKVLLEPVNRYETHMINRVAQAVEVCEKISSKGVGIIADTFHMNIEEKNLAETFRKYGKFIDHIHLVDSNRFLPGQGHTDFGPVFAALKEVGYKNSVSFECFVDGPQDQAMRQCVSFINNLRK